MKPITPSLYSSTWVGYALFIKTFEFYQSNEFLDTYTIQFSVYLCFFECFEMVWIGF